MKKADFLSSLIVPHNYIEEGKVNIEELNANEIKVRDDPEFALRISRRKFNQEMGQTFEKKAMHSPERRDRTQRVSYKP